MAQAMDPFYSSSNKNNNNNVNAVPLRESRNAPSAIHVQRVVVQHQYNANLP